MTLREWLRENRAKDGRRMSAAEFAAAVSRLAGRPAHRPVVEQTVGRWASGQRMPRRKEMFAVVAVTGGAVQATDLLAASLEYPSARVAVADPCPRGCCAPPRAA
jgi:DNA-binding transcriptional MocR family regulator